MKTRCAEGSGISFASADGHWNRSSSSLESPLAGSESCILDPFVRKDDLRLSLRRVGFKFRENLALNFFRNTPLALDFFRYNRSLVLIYKEIFTILG